jgi:hypothetical protein
MFDWYDTNVGRFTSEYGIQGMLCMESIKKFTIPSDWSLYSPVMTLHERHASKWGTLLHYLEAYYN